MNLTSEITYASIVKTLLYILAFFQIDKDLFVIFIICINFDMVFGVLKTWRWNSSEFAFKRLIWGFVSKIGILGIPAMVALIGQTLGKDFLITVDITIRLLIIAEAWSVMGNAYTLSTGKVVKDLDLFSLFFNWIRKSLYKSIQVLMSLPDDNKNDKK